MNRSDDERDDLDLPPAAASPEDVSDDVNEAPEASEHGSRPPRWSMPRGFRGPAVGLAAVAAIAVAVVIALVSSSLPWQPAPVRPDVAVGSPAPSSSGD